MPTRSRLSTARAVRGLVLLAAVAACTPSGPSAVSPQEAPDLAARLKADPNNQALLVRYAGALFAAGTCDTASAVARRAMAASPADAVPVMILGQCYEKANKHDTAIVAYDRYLVNNSKANGAPAIRARQMLARRDQAASMARQALIRETQLAQQPGDERTIGILPLTIVGDSSYQPLSRGLAQMMISDIGLLSRFKLVERLQVGALLDEMRLGQSSRVDAATAARVGRLIQAGQIVQGTANIPRTGAVRLDASVVAGTGVVNNADQVTGQIRELLRMEKELVVGVVTRLGYTLSQAERQAILENGTQNLQAFLAYSRGLIAEDAGDYSRAALHFQDAVQADPGFQAARDEQQAAAAAPAVESAQASELASAVHTTGQRDPSAEAAQAAPDAIQSAQADLAGNASERVAPGSSNTGDQVTNTTTAEPPTTTTSRGTTTTATGTVTIRFEIP